MSRLMFVFQKASFQKHHHLNILLQRNPLFIPLENYALMRHCTIVQMISTIYKLQIQNCELQIILITNLSILNSIIINYARATNFTLHICNYLLRYTFAPTKLTASTQSMKNQILISVFLVFPFFRLLPVRLMLWQEAFICMLSYKEKYTCTT